MRGFDLDGYCMVEGVIDSASVENLQAFVAEGIQFDARRGGARNLLDLPSMRQLAESPAVISLVESTLGFGAKVVRGTLFDKTSDANWKVPWHQDCSIAVVERIETEGYGPWSVKAGVVHVQPPAVVLDRMVSVRIHLDDCPAENGALKVVVGSHAMGKISEERIADVVSAGQAVTCAVGAGGALVMRPLLVHSSSAASHPGHRRVLHFDYADCELDGALHWAADATA